MPVKYRIKTRWKIGGSFLIFLLFVLLIPLPNPLFQDDYATILTASDGSLLNASIAGDQQWRFPPSDSIPEKFKIAIRLFEDEYFFYHPGINPISILRALRQNVAAGKIVSGGSTLSMQTVRIAFKNKPRSYLQKLYEIGATLKLELLYSKHEILKAYADHAPFGGNIIGLDAAARRYYGRPSHLLSWAETATLAILPNSPASIFPGKNEGALLKKRNALLTKLHNKGFIDKDALFLAMEEPLPQRIKPLPKLAYHLLHRAKVEGLNGTIIKSTLQSKLQVRAKGVVEKYSRQMAKNQIHNAAALVIEIESGNTVAYVGNTDNRGEHGQHVDVITSRRSPGSLLKPFLYAMALDDGLITPAQLLPDIPIFYKGFAPKNFDKEYRGAIPANEALISSLNVPFVHLLIEYGYERFHQKMVKMGFNSFDQPAGHYGLSLILGGAETTLWELANVYAGMARTSGNFMDRPIGKGYSKADYRTNTYLKNSIKEESQALSTDGFIRVPSIDFTLSAMQEVKRPEEESGWEFFGSSRSISWKTGTSYGFRDGWAIGLNGKYLVGVWIGNADGEGRPGLTGIRAAAPLLFEVFALLDGDSEPIQPTGALHKVCTESGMLAAANCPNTDELAMPGYMTIEKKCTYHQIIHVNEAGTMQVNSSCYPVAKMRQESRFILPPVQSWYYKKYHPSYKKLPSFAPDCTETNATPSFELIYPRQFTRVYIPLEQDGKKGNVIFEAAHEDKKGIIYWHLDDRFLGATQTQHQMGINADQGPHVLTILDEFGNQIRQRFDVIN